MGSTSPPIARTSSLLEWTPAWSFWRSALKATMAPSTIEPRQRKEDGGSATPEAGNVREEEAVSRGPVQCPLPSNMRYLVDASAWGARSDDSVCVQAGGGC
eukprot:scaffold685_cov281-Pinguiococcus_pyrenoidosus.AAC.17